MDTIFAKVIINNKSHQTDQMYTYALSEKIRHQVHVGSRVIVPFGIGNRWIEGFIIQIHNHADIPKEKIKTIHKIVQNSPSLSEELIKLCQWMKEKYLCKFIDAIQCVMPTGAALKNKKMIRLIDPNGEYKHFSSEKKLIIEAIKENQIIEEDKLKKQFKNLNVSRIIQNLKDQGIIKVYNQLQKNIKMATKKIVVLVDENGMGKIRKNATKQLEVVEFLKKHGQTEWQIMKESLNVSSSILKILTEKNIIEVKEIQKRRNPYDALLSPSMFLNLTPEQKKAMACILPTIDQNKYETFLIHGITGSGKTEVYMQLIQHLMKKSKESIVLLPEISLTTQMMERFKSRFGENIAILHSKLSLGERYDEWNRIKEGKAKIAIGPRSAVFAPFKNLGMIVIDEEHEQTYKSDHDPKYHTVEVAKFRCKKNQAILILGSATPCIESYYKTKVGEYKKISMMHRFNHNPLPHMQIIDMREELKNGNKSIFSKQLYQQIHQNINNHQQTILFLNRRGHSTFISCRSCGYVVKCPHCDISLTYHQVDHDLTCHYCGYKQNPPKLCPECHSQYIKYFGAGTERIETLTKKYFKGAQVARLDLDTTSKKGSMKKVLDAFKKGQIDILIGTQMIAKGLDFPNVTLVGVIAADTNLNLPDFRACEKTFQLITQVAGRAGRGNQLGHVIVQTYTPEHFSIKCAQKYDYEGFYDQEIALRQSLFYPPFCNMIKILFTGKDESQVIKTAHKVYEQFLKEIPDRMDVKNMILGPYPAPLSKIKGNYRWQMIMKTKSVDQTIIKGIIKDIRLKITKNRSLQSVKMSVDIDPYNIL